MRTIGLAAQSVFFTKFIFMQTVPLPASQKEYVCPLGHDVFILNSKNGMIGLSSKGKTSYFRSYAGVEGEAPTDITMLCCIFNTFN